jgi:hypothetical protein
MMMLNRNAGVSLLPVGLLTERFHPRGAATVAAG